MRISIERDISRRLAGAATALLGCLAPAIGASAQWTPDAGANTPIGDKAGDQVQAKVRSVPGGGSYVSWFDNNAGGYDVYLQRLDDKGREQWAHDGVLVADRGFSSTQDYALSVAADGDAYLAFRDDRFAGTQITAARITADGTLAWGVNGVQLTSTTAFVAAPKIAATTDGNVVVAWTQDGTVRAQKLDATGAPQWGAGLTLADPGGGSFSAADMNPSDAGSAILSWNREDSFLAPKHIWAQKIAADGTFLWNGGSPVVVFDGGSLQFGNFPTFVSDGGGGAVFGWYSSSPSLQCWAQRIRADGTEAFPHNGVAGSTNAARIRVSPSVDFDPATEETFLFWTEQNGAQSQFGVYGQKYAADGTRQWTDDGQAIVPVGGTEITQVRTLAAGGGATVFWVDKPSPPAGQRVRASRVDGAGGFAWSPATIVSASSVVSGKSRLATAADGAGAVLVWSDARTDGGDVYGQNVNGDGSLGNAGDVDGDGDVDFDDLLLVLSGWGPCPGCPADLDGDGVVAFPDLLLVLSGWC